MTYLNVNTSPADIWRAAAKTGAAINRVHSMAFKSRESYASFCIEAVAADWDRIANPAVWPRGAAFREFTGRPSENLSIGVLNEAPKEMEPIAATGGSDGVPTPNVMDTASQM